MAQTGYTPISIYYSATTTNVPTAANLVAGELAINTADGKLFYKDSSGVVQVIGTKGGVGSSSTTQVLYNSSGLVVGSANFTFSGTSLNLSNPSGSSAINITATSTNYASIELAGNGNTAGSTSFLLRQDASNIATLFNRANAAMTFSTNATEQMRIDASGNVGIGVTPSSISSSYKSIELGAVGNEWSSTSGTNNFSTNAIRGTSWTYGSTNKAFLYQQDVSGGHLWFYAPSGTAGTAISYIKAMTLDSSGNLLLGQTSPTVTGLAGSFSTPNAFYCGNATTSGRSNSTSANIEGNSGRIIVNHANGAASGSLYVDFSYNNSEVGSITQNGTTGVLYNLTSDYRLKDNPIPLTGASEFIMALQPKTWNWWDGSGKGVGFIAHEFMEVAKHSGNGEKDAVDTEGNPIYQTIQPSSSEVMANLVALVQELNTKVTLLEAQLAAKG